MALPEFRPTSRQQIRDALETALINEALFNIQENKVAELEVSINESNPALESLIETHRPEHLSLIRKELQKNRRRYFVTHTMPKVGRIAAALLLVIFIGLTTAIATVQSVRIKVLELLVRIENEYTQISLKEKLDAAFEVPADWAGEYYPSMIPADLTFDSIRNASAYSISHYKDSKGEYGLYFSESDSTAKANLDTENANITFITVHGFPALLSEKDGEVSIVWSDNVKFFHVFFMGDKDIAYEIANSVMRIK